MTVKYSSVHDFQKNGITGHEVGTTGADGDPRPGAGGVGPTAAIAQNGIEMAYGATGKITSNTVLDVSYTTGVPRGIRNPSV